MKTISSILILILTVPIWLFLLHRILESVHASELMWVLYWVYLPAVILANVLARIPEAKA